MPYLEIKLGPDTMLLRFVGRIDYVFGRLPNADVQLRDMKVSRLHTQVFIDSRGNAFMRDLGSSGGTFIGNQRLRQGVVAPLVDGSKFRIGESRLTFYDAEPPVNAIEPPGHSMPRGLIRTNARARSFEAEVTVLAMNKVDPETQSGPAEPPPEINPADFADNPKDLEQKKPPQPQSKPQPPARVPGKKRVTGIVEAPWEKPGTAAVEPGKEKRVTIPPPTRGGKPAAKAPPPMQSAEIDEMGQFHAPAAPARPVPQRPVSPLPPRVPQPEPILDETGITSREPAIPEPFKPPPPITGDLPIADDEEPRPRMGMPTVRLERPALQDRQKQIEQEEAEEAALLKIPTASVVPGAAPAADEAEEESTFKLQTASVKPDAPPIEDEAEHVPMIGSAPPRSDTPVASDEEELTDDQITEYLGGSVSGRYGDINFGDGDAGDDVSEDEVSFGGAAARIDLEDDSEIDLVDEEPAAGEPAAEAEEPVGVNTSMLGGTTAISEEAVEEAAEEAAEEAIDEPAEEAAPGAEEPVADDVPEYEHATPPPPSREGATADRAFKPRKTRKLMKRRKETGKITDKKNPTPLPQGAKTVVVPAPDMDQPIVPGSKTMFIPKPDAVPQPERPTGKPRAVPENLERKTLDDMAEGPGGDTVAMSPAMMKQLQDELKRKEEPPSIGDNPTVKLAGDDDEEEDEFVLDEDYAFFTPPPPTRKARDAAARAGKEDDVINASDFLGEADKLPRDKKAASSNDPDTLAE